MNLKHTGLVCAKEETADKFYQNLLGLTKNNPKILPRDLSKQIFGIDSELKMINYMNEDLHFEIFIHEEEKAPSGRIEHICIEVDDRKEFLNRCQSLGVAILQIQKEQKTLLFIWDFDRHLFEVKERE